MSPLKTDIIDRLRKDILWQQFKPIQGNELVNIELGAINQAFPNKRFPLAAVHEFCCTQTESVACTTGFIAGIISTLMRGGGATVWISASKDLFPPALVSFGIDPDKIVFVRLQKEKDRLWAMEEALGCQGLAAVVGEIPDLQFTASRRLQLAVEQSRVTGFIIRHTSRILQTTACVGRWKINSLSSALMDDLPGVGFPRWNVELIKIRNGRPGSWQVEWANGKFKTLSNIATLIPQQQKKTG
jgi:protein ImuA